MEAAAAGADGIHEPPPPPPPSSSSMTTDRKTDGSGRLKVICSYGGAFVSHPSGDPSPFFYTGGDSKLVYIDVSLPLILLISSLCSLFPGAGLDVSHIALKCRLPGDCLRAVGDVPDDDALRSIFSECLRRAKNPPPLAKKSAPLRLFLCAAPPPPDRASSSSPAVAVAAVEDPPLIDLSTPTSSNKTTLDAATAKDDIPPELVSLIEDLKDGVAASGAPTACLQPVSVQEESPPAPPSRWIKSRRSNGDVDPAPPKSPAAAVTRLLCDENGRVVGYCTLDPSFQPKNGLVVGPAVF